jgi:hypothetical protein
MWGNVWENYVR